MKFFRLPPKPRAQHQEETRLQSVARWCIIAILFAGVLWGFWINSERQMSRMQKTAQHRMDATGLLSEENEKQLSAYVSRFKEVYGITLVVSIRNTAFTSSYLEEAGKSGIMLLGLCPDARQVVFLAPPLAANVLGQSFIAYVRGTHFEPYFTDGNWPEGLAGALNLLSARLDAALAEGVGGIQTIQEHGAGDPRPPGR